MATEAPRAQSGRYNRRDEARIQKADRSLRTELLVGSSTRPRWNVGCSYHKATGGGAKVSLKDDRGRETQAIAAERGRRPVSPIGLERRCRLEGEEVQLEALL